MRNLKLFLSTLLALSAPSSFAIDTGAANQVYVIPSAGGRAKFAQLDLSQSAAVKNQLPVSKGGTGDATLTLNGIVFGNGTSAAGITAAGAQYQSCQAGASAVPTFDAVHLDQSAAVTGTLPATKGGTGQTSVASAFVSFFESVATTTGDLLYGGASGTPTRLAIGSSLQLLQVSGGVPTWAAIYKPRSESYTEGFGGYGATNNKIPYWSAATDTGSDITSAVTDTTNGGKWTINTTGVYGISVVWSGGASANNFGISKNSAQLTTGIGSITAANRLAMCSTSANGPGTSCTIAAINLTAADVIRVHTDGNSSGFDSAKASVRITLIYN